MNVECVREAFKNLEGCSDSVKVISVSQKDDPSSVARTLPRFLQRLGVGHAFIPQWIPACNLNHWLPVRTASRELASELRTSGREPS